MNLMQLEALRVYVVAFVVRRFDGRRDERGTVSLEKVIIAAIAVAAAIAVGYIIYNKAVNKANTIDTTTNPGGS